MSLSRLVFRAGYGIQLYRFLIIAFLSTYDRGDYDLLRAKASSTIWISLQDCDIHKYANNMTDKIMAFLTRDKVKDPKFY